MYTVHGIVPWGGSVARITLGRAVTGVTLRRVSSWYYLGEGGDRCYLAEGQ